ncbi:hypothetical protein CC80DRAFT_554296 [Byssothecium circinans]|uniref:Rhodopsin domain-containing protein n=1 Tax=Byssothecium circinans TaxID=147558 RepID=A0A6A5TFX3_9PLEO|nr:hypothetical protein CC80DRAFT_554296 [Byssothecium circinans]
MPSPDLLNRPMATPPPGVVPDFKHPQGETALAYLTLAIALSSVTLFAWFRFLVKLWLVRTLHLEDYFIPFAWWYRVGFICYNISIVLIKVSMLIQVLRIFVPRGAQSKTYWACHALIWMNSLYYVIAVFLMIFTCRPISKAWQPWIEGHCLDMAEISISTSIVNLVGDLSILFLTQVKIWNLMRMERQQRIKLSVVFCAALIPCGFAIMCLYYNAKQKNGHDFTYHSAYMAIACYGEIASGMFVLFLPMLPRFFTHMKEIASTFTSTAQRKQNNGLEFSDIGARSHASRGGHWADATAVRDPGRTHSLWHVSYSERGSNEDRRPIMPSSGGSVRGWDTARSAGDTSIVVKTEVSVMSNEPRR